MSFFDDLKKKAMGVVAQINPLDHGATYSSTVNAPSTPRISTPSINVQTPRFSQPNYNTPNIQSPNFSTPKMSNPSTGFAHSFTNFASHQLKDLGTSVGLGAVRSGIGTAQAVSGLYDTLTPGTGTNRFSKALDTQAKFVDQTAKPYNQVAYKGGQLAGDALTFAGAGRALKAAAEVPRVAQYTAPIARVAAPIDNGLNKVTTSLAQKGAGGRIASAAIHSATRPANIGANVAMTANYTGQQASKGVDINPAEVGRNLALGSALSLGIPGSGQALKEGLRAATPAARNTVKTAQAVKYTADKLDPGIRELDNQYTDLNNRWQSANSQQRKNIEKAIAANRQARNERARVSLGNSIRPTNGADANMAIPPQEPQAPQSLGRVVPLDNGVASSSGSVDPLAALKQEALPQTVYKGFKKDGTSTASGQGDAFYVTPHEHIAKTYDEGVGVKQYNFAPDTKAIDWKSPEYKAIQDKHMVQVPGGEPGYRKPDYNAINAELKKKGYDVVSFKTPNGDSPQLAVLNKSKVSEKTTDPLSALKQEAKQIKTRTIKTADGRTEYVAQLGNNVTDRVGRTTGFKAHSTSPNFKTEGEMNKWITENTQNLNLDKPADSLSQLKQEALKYKSADEFHQAQMDKFYGPNGDQKFMGGLIDKYKGQLNGKNTIESLMSPVEKARYNEIKSQPSNVDLTDLYNQAHAEAGGTLRPGKAPTPFKNNVWQGELSPERATRTQRNVNDMKAWMASGNSKYADIADTPVAKLVKTQRLSNERFKTEAQRVRDNLRTGEVGYVKDGSHIYEISREHNRARPIKSANEPTPKEAYHSTAALKIEGDKLRASTDGELGPGVYLHTNESSAKTHAAMQADGNMADQTAHKVKINSDKIFNLNDQNYPEPSLVNMIKSDGYDGIKLKTGEIVVFDPNKVELQGVAHAEAKPTIKVASDPMQTVFDHNPLSPTNQLETSGRGTGTVRTAGQTPVRQLSEGLSRTSPASTKELASYPHDTPLPVEGTRQVGLLDKALRSTRSIIERQGEHGRQLADMLQGARDKHELMLGDIQKQIPTVRSLKGKTYENFVDATQGLAKPINDKVAKAVEEWQAVHPQIRDRAVAAGLDVGNLGPKYYPHFIDYQQVFKDKNMYNAAVNHLVETGQAGSPEEAIQLLNYAKDVSRNRQFGNLESSRLVDLPFYDKTPNSLISYLNGSAKRIAQTETFGKQDEKALKLIAQAGVKGYDTEAMKNAYDIAVGAKQYNPTASKVSGNIRKYVTTTRLGLGALTNISQNVNTGIVTGHLRTLGAAVKQLDPKTRAFVGDTGVIADAVLNDLKTQSGYSSFSQKVLGKAINKITAPGFGAVEKMNRSIAATAGRDYALRLAQRGNEKVLRNLGVTGEIKNKTLTEAQQIQAARKIVEKTQFKVDPQDLPGWTDSPGGKLVAQFRTFSYKQGQFVNNEIIKPAARGNLLPLGRLLAALPVGYGLYQTKTAISGRPNNDSPTKQGLQAFQNVGGAGLVFDMYQSLNPIGSKYLPSDRRQSMAVGAFGGPALGTATQAVGAISDLIQRKNTPSDTSRLEGKVALGNNGDSYTDATPAARFALQQIPVVGTAIKNRVLPFQTESNADAGKLPGEGKASALSVTTSSLKPADQIKAAFTTPEGKAFIKLTDAQKKEAAQTDPTMRGLYDEYTSMKTALGGGKTLYPAGLNKDYAKQQLGLDNFDPVQVLNRFDRLTPKGKDTVLNKENDAEFKLEVANYLRNKADGKISAVDDLKTQNKLAKLYVGKEFSKDVRDLHTTSKTLLYGYLTKSQDGQKLAEQILAYDDALTAAGVQAKNKFRDKYGNPDFDPASSSSGSKKGSSRKGSRALPTFATPKTVKISGAAHFKSHKVSVKAKKIKTSIRTHK